MRYVRLGCVAALLAGWSFVALADEPDWSKPESVVLAYGKAFHDVDVPGAKALATGTNEQLAGQEQFITLAHARANLYQTAVDKFGEEGKKVIDFKGELGDWLMHQDNWKLISVGGSSEKMMVVAKNSIAMGGVHSGPKKPTEIVSSTGPSEPIKPARALAANTEPVGSHVQLKKMDGKWKVDLYRIEYVHESTPPYAGLIKVFDDVAAGIKGGKYATALDAKQDMQRMSSDALKTRSGKHTTGRGRSSASSSDPPPEQ